MVTYPDLDKVGVMLFEFVNEPQLMEVHVFRTQHYEGEPQETEGGEADTFVVVLGRHDFVADFNCTFVNNRAFMWCIDV